MATVPGPLRQHTGGPALGIQIGFGWTDFHLHRFRVQKKSYTTPRIGSVEGHDALQVKLMALQFRINERFLYEDDFGDLWQHEIRIEKHCVIENGRTYLVCVGGSGAGHQRTVEARTPSWPADRRPLSSTLSVAGIHRKVQEVPSGWTTNWGQSEPRLLKGANGIGTSCRSSGRD